MTPTSRFIGHLLTLVEPLHERIHNRQLPAGGPGNRQGS